jgi:hypothetical protein
MHRVRISMAISAAAMAVASSGASAQWRYNGPLAPADIGAGDRFGTSTAAWSNRLATGAPYHHDGSGSAAGAVFVHEFTGGGWSTPAAVFAPDGAEGDEFGRSVAMCCDTLFVGAPGDDDNGEGSGSVYVFTRDGPGSWSLLAKLAPGDGAECDRFGWSVSTSAGVAVIGAWSDDAGCPGTHAAYIFEEIGGVWSEAAKVLPQSGDGSEQFGHAVATSVGRVLVGAWGNDDAGADSGAVYTYEKIEDVWVVTAIHRADDTAPGDQFGFAVAASGELAAIGAPGDADGGTDAGSGYIFAHQSGAWSQSTKLLPDSGGPGDRFGAALDVSGAWAAVGAPMRDFFGNGGAVYPFENAGGSWVQADVLHADGSAAFGSAVTVSGNVLLVGDPSADASGEDAGLAHVLFACYADFNHDGEFSTLDVLAYLNAWNARDPAADCDGCGTIDIRDFTCFLNQWASASCH